MNEENNSEDTSYARVSEDTSSQPLSFSHVAQSTPKASQDKVRFDSRDDLPAQKSDCFIANRVKLQIRKCNQKPIKYE